jgi:hypothetical protein
MSTTSANGTARSLESRSMVKVLGSTATSGATNVTLSEAAREISVARRSIGIGERQSR